MSITFKKGQWWLVGVAALFLVMFAESESHAKQPVLSYGDRYGYVYDLQYRLYQLGYFQSHQNGIFGPKTQDAVIRFQRDYGLRVDGIVGTNTWNALYRHTYTKSEIDLLTRLVYAEARGEPYVGQVAVADVVLNRVHSSLFPNTIAGVIYQPLAFESVSNGTIWLQPNQTARKAVIDAIRGWSPAYGSLYFFNPAHSTSKWIWSRRIVTRIGNHLFAI